MINERMIDGCSNCGTFQRIPIEDLHAEGINEIICESCLKETLDNDDSSVIIKELNA